MQHGPDISPSAVDAPSGRNRWRTAVAVMAVVLLLASVPALIVGYLLYSDAAATPASSVGGGLNAVGSMVGIAFLGLGALGFITGFLVVATMYVRAAKD
jgi:hypothetical protein